MDDSTDKAAARRDQRYDARVGSCLRWLMLGMVMMAVSPVLRWAGLATGWGWWPRLLWSCQVVGIGLVFVTSLRLMLGRVGQRPTTPADPAPRVPASPEVQAHQRRMDSGQDPDDGLPGDS
ncbi:hypothetical protein [Streptomyces sp. gb14]|uniref:hypothetical protein n=1 Tax=Streptomyces sp. gb14 TaxID=1827753 RepID=UPI000BF14E35|nr:hypothetical protein [Streptomyces sp. gb14]